MRWIVDGMNVIGTKPDGWWRDRSAARVRLTATIATFEINRSDLPPIIVFDGRPKPDELVSLQKLDVEVGEAGSPLSNRIEVRYAPGGRDAADDAIVAIVSVLSDPEQYTVVTSDSGLIRRLERYGVGVEKSGAFLARTDGQPKLDGQAG